MPYRFLADVVLVVHLGVILCVVGGLACVLIGNLAGVWRWANSLSFRLLHLAAILIVVLQAWLGQECPLTTLESWLRVQSGQTSYDKGFIEHWAQWVIFYQAPSWVFTSLYSVFGLLVLATWVAYPPRRHTGENRAA